MSWWELAYFAFIVALLQMIAYAGDEVALQEKCGKLPQKMYYNPLSKSRFFCKEDQVWVEVL